MSELTATFTRLEIGEQDSVQSVDLARSALQLNHHQLVSLDAQAPLQHIKARRGLLPQHACERAEQLHFQNRVLVDFMIDEAVSQKNELLFH